MLSLEANIDSKIIRIVKYNGELIQENEFLIEVFSIPFFAYLDSYYIGVLSVYNDKIYLVADEENVFIYAV